MKGVAKLDPYFLMYRLGKNRRGVVGKLGGQYTPHDVHHPVSQSLIRHSLQKYQFWVGMPSAPRGVTPTIDMYQINLAEQHRHKGFTSCQL